MIREGLLTEHRSQDRDQEIHQGRRSKASSKRWPRWASRRFKVIAARRFLRPSASTARSWTNISPGRRRASRASASTSSREEALARHRRAFPTGRSTASSTPAASINGATAANITCSIRRRSTSCKPPAAWAATRFSSEYAELINNQAKNLCTLRGLLDFKFAEKPLPIEEVESVENIVKRFKTGAMSYGSISQGSARNARHRDEPHRRQEQHRRRRRRPGALHSGSRTATRRIPRSSRSPAAGSA